jgi:alkanesulfonate monooxygenase SsuD/methylene tetrahydromethanopterin reductase-like flavin-dependent oxidoreductase (luciferase family)
MPMDVGLAIIFQATDKSRSDLEVYQQELRLGEMAESLGFQSIWGVEHHFTDYTMCPDVLQMLTYFAAKSDTLLLGSMVVVLPWHHPMRVAEEVSMLDHLSNGRVILGLGRGLGRIEFDGFGVDMNKSRELFNESAEMILSGLEQGWCEYDGKYIKQARRDIRPRPHTTFRGRSYAAAVSPESFPIVARLGLGLCIIPQKPWEIVAEELATYRQVYRESNGDDAPAPIVAGWTFCDEDEGRARDMALKYIGGYWRTVIDHYEFTGAHLAQMKGYENYARMQEIVTAPGGTDAMTEFFLNLQIWGTPEQCYEKIMTIKSLTGAGAYNAVFSYAGMPYEDAERSMRLFARTVLPRLQALDDVPLGVPRPAAA